MCQRLTYEEFVQKLRKWIIKAAHLPEDYVFFKKKENLFVDILDLKVDCSEIINIKEAKLVYVNGKGKLTHAVNVNDLLKQVVPDLNKQHHSNNHYRRFDRGNKDRPQDSHSSSTINGSCLVKFLGNCHQELTDQKNIEESAAS